MKFQFFLLFIFFNFSIFAQQKNSNEISEKEFTELSRQTEGLVDDFPDSAKIAIDKLLDIAKKSNSKQFLANALSSVAYVKSGLSLTDEALIANEKSFTINQQLNSKDELAKNYTLFGKIYFRKGNYIDATKNYLKSIEIGQKEKLYEYEQAGNVGLADINRAQQKYEVALQYALKAVEIEKSSPNEVRRSANYMSVASCYAYLKKDSLAEHYFIQAAEILKKFNKQFSLAYILVERSNIYYESNLLESIKLELEAQKILDVIAPKRLTSGVNLSNLGESYFNIATTDSLFNAIKSPLIPVTKEKMLITAENYFKRALEIAQINQNVHGVLQTSGLISNVQAYMGDYKSAYSNLKMKFKLNDSLFSQKNKNAIAKLESENEILQLTNINKQKSTLNKILVGSAIGLVLFSLLGYRNFKNKQKVSSQQQEIQEQKITELEKDKQLSAIDAMLKGQEEERSRIAKDLHDGLGGMLSGTKLSFINMKENLVLTPENATLFDKSLSMLDNTIADLRKVAHNLMPEALVKFGLDEAVKDFCSSIQSSSSLKVVYQQVGEKRKLTNTAEVFTYRIIQELVNNAVKHAGAKQIIVQLNINSHKLSITVEDDGKGFDVNSIANSKGAGMDNIKYRVQYFNGTLDIVTAPGKGTSVNIELNA
jgi:two-component system, NarL family, sensor kinase